jgi:predicted lipoprotein with Yx(FWY)xxD motif
MSLIHSLTNRWRFRSLRLAWVAGPLLAVAVVIAGCGSSSHAATRAAMHEHMKSSHAMSHGAMAGGEMHAMHAFAHAELTVHPSEYGSVIFDQNHTALYLFSADRTPTSTCYGACQAAWPPLLTRGSPRVGPGLDPSLVGTTRRKDGSLQVTYRGHPLYFYSGDRGTRIGCQHVKLHGGFWYVVNASGTPNLSKSKAMM